MALTSQDLRIVVAAAALTLGTTGGCGASPTNAQLDDDGGSGDGSGSGGRGGGSGGGSGSSSGSTGSHPDGGAQDGAVGPGIDASTGESGGSDSSTAADSAEEADAGPVPTGKQLFMWVPTWVDFANSLSTVTGSNPRIATIVSPDFYDFNANGDYTSGPPALAPYSGTPTIAQVVQQVHAAGMRIVPLVYGGASNLSDGTDQGIQNVLSKPATQTNFITAMVAEAQAQHYDGWNLDWEVGTSTTNSKYGAELIAFLGAFESALHAHGMILTIDVGQWFIFQCGGDGLVDLTQIGAVVDYVIMEDYVTDYGTPVSSCPSKPPAQNDCTTFADLVNLMCDVSPSSAVMIGLDSEPGGTTSLDGTTEGTSPILPQALSAISAAGFTGVAVWPDGTPFLDPTGVPDGQTWVSLLGQWLNQ